MDEKNLINITEDNFESIKHLNENGVEYWYARELQNVLNYKEWRKFENVINKAKEACENSGISVFEHFVDIDKTIKMPKDAEKTIADYKLTRYACYLIAQNGDSRKKAIALAQTYFAVQTRKQELTRQEYEQLSEDEKRLYTRKNVKDKNINNEDDACKTHHNVGQAVRQTIKRIGSTMPEDLPTPSKSAKQIEKEKNKKLKVNDKKRIK